MAEPSDPHEFACKWLGEPLSVLADAIERRDAQLYTSESAADEALGAAVRKLATPKTGPIDIVCNADATLWRVTCGTVLAGSWQATAPTLDAAVSAALKESEHG